MADNNRLSWISENYKTVAVIVICLCALGILLAIFLTDDKEENKNIFLAVGNDNSFPNSNIIYSEDGINWENISKEGACFKTVDNVAFGTTNNKNEKLWVAVGDDDNEYGRIKSSKTGFKWTNSSENGISFKVAVFNVAHGFTDKDEPLWVAVGDQNAGGGGNHENIAYSYDGSCWQYSSPGASFSNQATGVAYGVSDDKKTGLWVAVGNNGNQNDENIIFSTNGISWQNNNGGGVSFSAGGNGVAYGVSSDKETGLWVAVGDNGTSPNAGNIIFSLNGQQWKTSTGVSFLGHGNNVAQGLSSDDKTVIWVAAGNNDVSTGASAGNLLFSLNGQEWQESRGASFAFEADDVTFGRDRNNKPIWVATGNDFPGGTSAGNVLFSLNGQDWQVSKGVSLDIKGSGVGFGSTV